MGQKCWLPERAPQNMYHSWLAADMWGADLCAILAQQRVPWLAVEKVSAAWMALVVQEHSHVEQSGSKVPFPGSAVLEDIWRHATHLRKTLQHLQQADGNLCDRASGCGACQQAFYSASAWSRV